VCRRELQRCTTGGLQIGRSLWIQEGWAQGRPQPEEQDDSRPAAAGGGAVGGSGSHLDSSKDPALRSRPSRGSWRGELSRGFRAPAPAVPPGARERAGLTPVEAGERMGGGEAGANGSEAGSMLQWRGFVASGPGQVSGGYIGEGRGRGSAGAAAADGLDLEVAAVGEGEGGLGEGEEAGGEGARHGRRRSNSCAWCRGGGSDERSCARRRRRAAGRRPLCCCGSFCCSDCYSETPFVAANAVLSSQRRSAAPTLSTAPIPCSLRSARTISLIQC
jgi:hypothetical protein